MFDEAAAALAPKLVCGGPISVFTGVLIKVMNMLQAILRMRVWVLFLLNWPLVAV